MPEPTHQAAAAKTAKSSATIKDLERMIEEQPSPEQACQKLAQILKVNRNEVALLRVDKGSLRFVYPTELRAAGVIPISGSAVAARTAATKTPLLSNSFIRVKHVSLFESVKLGGTEGEGHDQMPIQKIMSVPSVDAQGKVVGVLQISRKGLDSSLAGSDFTGDELKLLEQAAALIGRMAFMQEGTPLPDSTK
jgi:GAF domain-containing protein